MLLVTTALSLFCKRDGYVIVVLLLLLLCIFYRFPFDCQDFTINIRSVIGSDKCDLLPMPRTKGSIVPIQFFSKDSVVDEWQFVNILCEFRFNK